MQRNRRRFKDTSCIPGTDHRIGIEIGRAPYKYPRAIALVPERRKTATGKIQRFKLRDLGN